MRIPNHTYIHHTWYYPHSCTCPLPSSVTAFQRRAGATLCQPDMHPSPLLITLLLLLWCLSPFLSPTYSSRNSSSNPTHNMNTSCAFQFTDLSLLFNFSKTYFKHLNVYLCSFCLVPTVNRRPLEGILCLVFLWRPGHGKQVHPPCGTYRNHKTNTYNGDFLKRNYTCQYFTKGLLKLLLKWQRLQ